jgi:hypothetical protein
MPRAKYSGVTLNVGNREMFAQSRQRAPTGVWTRQRGQMGVSHLPQRR